jgi:hypothetical protein
LLYRATQIFCSRHPPSEFLPTINTQADEEVPSATLDRLSFHEQHSTRFVVTAVALLMVRDGE